MDGKQVFFSDVLYLLIVAFTSWELQNAKYERRERIAELTDSLGIAPVKSRSYVDLRRTTIRNESTFQFMCDSDVEFEFEAFRDPDNLTLAGRNSLLVYLASILERYIEACGQYSVKVEALYHESVANKARREKAQRDKKKRPKKQSHIQKDCNGNILNGDQHSVALALNTMSLADHSTKTKKYILKKTDVLGEEDRENFITSV